MATLYSIRDWDKNFEVAQSRKIVGPLDWVGLPTKHDGKSFRRIMLMDDGPAIYGYWVLIVQVAAKCPTRGVLADADGPLDAEDLAIKTGGKPELFDKALKALSVQKIGWINAVEVGASYQHATSTLPLPDLTLPDLTNPTNQPGQPPAAGLAGGALELQNGNGKAAPRKPRSGGKLPAEWEPLADRLAAMGVTEGKAAIRGAIGCGCSPELATAIVDFGLKNGFGQGAIVCRLGKARPALAIDLGWPGQPESVKKSEAAKAAREAEKKRDAAESLATSLIKRWRIEGKLEPEMRANLSSQGLWWPGEYPQPAREVNP